MKAEKQKKITPLGWLSGALSFIILYSVLVAIVLMVIKLGEEKLFRAVP